jgi:hypothetical protein
VAAAFLGVTTQNITRRPTAAPPSKYFLAVIVPLPFVTPRNAASFELAVKSQA